MLALRGIPNSQNSHADIQLILFSGVLEADMSSIADFFRNRLDQMIDLRHPLAVLSNRIPW